MKFNSNIDFTEITAFAQSFGVSIGDRLDAEGACYEPDFKRIKINSDLPENRKLMSLAHEIGHALQSPAEFEIAPYPSIDDMRIFIFAIEEDAWVKGKAILQNLYPYLSKTFWEEFDSFTEYALGTYYECSASRIYEIFISYKYFLNEAHKNSKPVCINSLFVK